jgi:hypothetical protein
MVALPWSQEEISKLVRYYGRVKPQLLAESFDGRSVGAVKDRILHYQKSGILPEINDWTLEEALFLCDVYRLYSVEELHVYMQHPRWSIQRRLSIITDGSQPLSNTPWSSVEEKFLVEKITDLSIKEISVYLGRSDADVKARIDSLFAIGRTNVSSAKLKDFFYHDTPNWGMRSCIRCNANIKIRFNEYRMPDHLFCSMKCKFALPSTKKSFLYLLLDEKRTMKDIARFLKITEAKANTLLDLYFPEKLAKPKVSTKQPTAQPSLRSGKRDDLNGIYMRSSWEANLARILNKNKKKWEYEPKTFVFKNITRGSVTYTPDFYVKDLEGRGKHVWIEVKGKMNSGDYTKLLNLKRCYPAEFKKLRGVVVKNSKAEKSFKRLGIPIIWYYGDLRKEYAATIPNWEGQ